ncbi:MAG: hypothetical protein QG622_553 [Actinomycetota bacterium]|nr:hypothetical protein [Actinomycetota bacterium]
MEDRDILDCIHALVAQERRLRDESERGDVPEDVEQERLTEIGQNLAQMWDLLRRRRAMRDAGQDPDVVDIRPSTQVDACSQ